MIKSAIFTGCATLALAATGAATAAQANTGSTDYFQERIEQDNIPHQLDRSEREYYARVFTAIDEQRWSDAQSLIDSQNDGLLHAVAKAELYLAANSPRVEMGPLLALLEDAPAIPQAAQLGRLAERRGATLLPDRPQIRQLMSYAGAPRRGKPRTVADATMPEPTKAAILDRIVNDDPAGAESLLLEVESSLSSEARTEWRQRVAWSYYIENDDVSSLRLARSATSDASGTWTADSFWVMGLAAWRLKDCATASHGFDNAARTASDDDMRAAAYFWASRANTKCREPHKVEANLRKASLYDETLYGILAIETLGLKPPTRASVDFSDDDWDEVKDRKNVRIAVALTEIGKGELADEVLRHQAQIGGDEEYAPLLRLARDLSLPAAQIWMAHRGPASATPDPAARYPSPKWAPRDGWRVDPALVFAHTMQESAFQTRAASPAGAYGLMQVRPIAARDIDRNAGREYTATISDLYDPSINLEYGQSYLEQLRDLPQTQGLLPKVIAAYNAGPTPVERWNYEVRDMGDPLLFIESIPYWETRGYVGTILRNYWMYERQAGVESQTAKGLAQGLWPTFPANGKVHFVRRTPGRGSSDGD